MLNSETCVAKYDGDGVAKEFAIPFKYCLNQDLTAQIQVLSYDGTNITPLEQVTDYTVSGDGEKVTGKIVFATAPAAGTKLAILRDIPLIQLSDWVNGEQIDLEEMEMLFDRLTECLQQISERSTRSATLSVFSEVDPDKTVEATERFAGSAQDSANTAVTKAQEAADSAEDARRYAQQAAAGQVNSDWEEDDPDEPSYIDNKPTNLITTGNIGQYIPVDTMATYTELEGTYIAASTKYSYTLDADKSYIIDQDNEHNVTNYEFVLPTIDDATKVHQIVIKMRTLNSLDVDWGTTVYFNGEKPVTTSAGLFTVFYDYNPITAAWSVGVITEETAA